MLLKYVKYALKYALNMHEFYARFLESWDICPVAIDLFQLTIR